MQGSGHARQGQAMSQKQSSINARNASMSGEIITNTIGTID